MARGAIKRKKLCRGLALGEILGERVRRRERDKARKC
jgi:hypothetical protein